MNLFNQKRSKSKIVFALFFLVVVIPILITIIGYISVVTRENEEYDKKFYKSSFSGIIYDIEISNKDRGEYVVRLNDSKNNKKTIGITEITNFSKVLVGDTLSKKHNSYELEISGMNGKITSIVKFNSRKAIWGF